MKVSYDWLQTYFEKPLPSAADIAQALIGHAFEVEDLETVGSDAVMDIKVLPDRAHDCLSHFGIAKEIAAIMNLATPSEPVLANFTSADTKKTISVSIVDDKLCRRYIGRVVEGVTVGPSPDWLKARLEAVGQRSINNIVDATNFVLLDIGQPLHAFDADKVKGDIIVRPAQDGETIVTLDNRDIALDPSMLVIADAEGPLAIAGVKGGKRAEVDAATKNIILESANFDPTATRKTATKLNLRTDAVKRFENELSQTVADFAMDKVTALIAETGPEVVVGHKVDIYPVKREPVTIKFTKADVDAILGIELSVSEITTLLERLQIVIKEEGEILTAYPPVERLDLEIKENIIEEIGRLYGYERIPSVVPLREHVKEVNQTFKVANKIRELLAEAGFTEVYGYSFTTAGDIELQNPLVSGEQFLRTNLTERLKEKIDFNLRHTLFDQEAVKLFDIGNVFTTEEQSLHCAIGIGYKTKKLNKSSDEILVLLECLRETFDSQGIEVQTKSDETSTIVEFTLAPLAEKVDSELPVDLAPYINENRYQKFSQYPRIIRDVALFVPPTITPQEVISIIKNQATDLLIHGPVLFDVFEKKNEEGKVEKTSLAFRMVFQSFERTLSDEEVNKIMNGVTEALKAQNWEIR